MTEGQLAFVGAGFLAAAIVGTLSSRALIPWLRQRQQLDLPNQRSSHVIPTPRGGGLAVVATLVLVAGGLGFAIEPPPETVAVAAGVALLAVVSWLDDRNGLSAPVRFGAQAIAVAAVLYSIPTDQTVFGHDALVWWERAALGAGLMWWINLYNFMDGIDGLCGTHSAFVGLGVALLGLHSGLEPWLVASAAILCGACLGFLTVNWNPARVFLGDVGSVPLGLMTGYLLIKLSFSGAWAAAILIGAYFATDATLTLLMRASRGERIWEAHRSHFYQRAAAVDRNHAAVVGLVIAGLAGLLGLAAVSIRTPWVAIAMGAALVAALLIVLSQRAQREQRPPS